MSIFFKDTFAVSGPLALESHTPETGSGYTTTQTAGSVIITSSSHECRPLAPSASTDANHYYKNLTTPPSADYTVDFVFDNHEASGAIGDAFRGAWRFTDDNNFLMCQAFDNGTFDIYKWVSGAYTHLVGGTASALTAGQTPLLRLTSTGNNHSATWNGTTITATDTSITSAGTVALTWNASAGWTDANRLNLKSITAYTGALSPTVTPSTASIAVAGTATLTASNFTGGTVTWSSSNTGVATVGSSTGIVTGVAAGTATITATGVSVGTETATSVVTVTSTGTTIPVTDGNISLSPYNWFAGSGYIKSCYAGAYLKLAVTGTTTLSMNVDNTDLNAISGIITTGYPEIAYTVNGGPIIVVQLASGVSSPISLTGLSGVTQIKVWLKSVNHNYNAYTADANAIKITGFTGDGGCSTTALTGYYALKPKRMIAFGDSIMCGFYVNGLADDRNSDSTLSYIRDLSEALNAEVGVVACPGQGINAPGNMGFAACYNSADSANQAYQYHFSGQFRLTGGALSPVPDYVWLAHGANDTANAAYQTSYAALLAILRTIGGGSARIYAQVPFGGFCRTQITAAVASVTDAKLTLVDCGTTAQIGCDDSSGGTGTVKTTDGIHPTPRGHGEMAARAANALNIGGSVSLDSIFGSSFIRGSS